MYAAVSTNISRACGWLAYKATPAPEINLSKYSSQMHTEVSREWALHLRGSYSLSTIEELPDIVITNKNTT